MEETLDEVLELDKLKGLELNKLKGLTEVQISVRPEVQIMRQDYAQPGCG